MIAPVVLRKSKAQRLCNVVDLRGRRLLNPARLSFWIQQGAPYDFSLFQHIHYLLRLRQRP